MAEVRLTIGGHSYALTCADGEEAELMRLGGIVDEQVEAARSAIGGISETRQLLLAALFLADKLPVAPDDNAAERALVARIDAMAEQVARIAARLSAA